MIPGSKSVFGHRIKILPGLVALFFFQSCIQHPDSQQEEFILASADSVHVLYAKGFNVTYKEGYVELVVHEISGNSPFSDTLYVQTRSGSKVPNPKRLVGKMNSVLCQSSTHLAFLDELGVLNKVSGVCGMDYLADSLMLKKLQENGVAEICASETVKLETIQALSPDMFFIYPFDTEGKQKYDEAGIQTFYIAEYLETSALARLEWIKLFGILTGKVKEANDYFERVEKEYKDLQMIPELEVHPSFFLNLPFKDNWYMPSANSLIVGLIEESGLNYYYPNSGSTENDVHSKEEVWNDATFADYWIIMAGRPNGYSMADLIAEEPAYAGFKAVHKKQVIFCNTTTSNYFSKGVMEPQVMLKDILHAIGRMEDHEPVYFFLLE